MNVAVLAGGQSPEHEVSLASAEQVLEHLDRRHWQVWPVWIDKRGQWWVRRQALPAAEAWRRDDGAAHLGPLRPGTALDWLLDEARIEVVFPVLHGPRGEDGTVQGMLELYGLPCVGSGCAASAVAMDKLRTREVFAANGIPLAPAYVPTVPLAHADVDAEYAAMTARLGSPTFVKVDASGSTVGVHRITCRDDFTAFVEEFRGRFRRWFAESAVVGEEITVAVLGNTGATLQPLPPVGIYPRCATWFTHEAKYLPGGTEEVVPPRGLSPAQIEQVQELGRRCHELLVCDGMSRTDMIVTDAGPIVLETNTIPGLTRTSLLPQAAAAAGMSFAQLLDRLLHTAMTTAAPGRAAPSARPGQTAAAPAPAADMVADH